MTSAAYRPDRELKSAVDAEIDRSPDVASGRIGAAVSDGTVILSGQVEAYPQKVAAVDAARRVRGVRAVADEITVQGAWRGPVDAEIARGAADALERSIAVPAGSVQAVVHQREVTLTGEVAWEYQRQAATDAVAALADVAEVLNLITLRVTS